MQKYNNSCIVIVFLVGTTAENEQNMPRLSNNMILIIKCQKEHKGENDG
jgi:hypothetical protein